MCQLSGAERAEQNKVELGGAKQSGAETTFHLHLEFSMISFDLIPRDLLLQQNKQTHGLFQFIRDFYSNRLKQKFSDVFYQIVDFNSKIAKRYVLKHLLKHRNLLKKCKFVFKRWKPTGQRWTVIKSQHKSYLSLYDQNMGW